MSGGRSERGFTIVMCTEPGCGAGDESSEWARTVKELGEVVRASRHGVLVMANCLVGRAACRLRHPAPLVVVQPCDAHRRPTALAMWVGPVRTAADVAELGGWLADGDLEPALLSARLLRIHRRSATAPLN